MQSELTRAVRRIARLILAQRREGNGADRINVEPQDLQTLITQVPPGSLIETLNVAVGDATAMELGGQRWALSPCDVALTGPVTHSGTLMMLLHPADAPTTGLDEMPEHMRILGIVIYPPYRLFRRPGEPPAEIALHRRKALAYAADQKSLTDVADLYHRLLVFCREALDSQPRLDAEVIDTARSQYDQARELGPDDGLVHAVRAASALGLIPFLFAGVLSD